MDSTATKYRNEIAQLKGALRQYPDFPEKGILFEDIMPIFQSPSLFESLTTILSSHITALSATKIVGLDARGFILTPPVCLKLKLPFIPVRKTGKLPGACLTATYEKEYGMDSFQMQVDAIQPGDRVVVIDDIIATGGSAKAAGELVEQAGAKVVQYVFLLELEFLKGRDKLNAEVFTLLSGQS